MLLGLLFEGFVSSVGNITHAKQLAGSIYVLWIDLLHDSCLGIWVFFFKPVALSYSLGTKYT